MRVVGGWSAEQFAERRLPPGTGPPSPTAWITATDRGHEERARRLLVKGTAPEVTHAFDAAAGPVVPETEETEETADVITTSGRRPPEDRAGTGATA
jgi:hypothetical protein